MNKKEFSLMNIETGIKQRKDNIIIYEDDSVLVQCSTCKNFIFLEKDEKRAIALSGNTKLADNETCRSCYFSVDEAIKPNDVQDRIAWNSALNNAVALVSSLNLANNDEARKQIAEWQKYFYEVIINR